MLGQLAKGCGAKDQKVLFSALDERARHSLDAIVSARKKARQRISADYPSEARAEALEALGDAVSAPDGVALFAQRCGDVCLTSLCAGVGALTETREEGPLLVAKTVRGAELTLYRAKDQRYGIVWQSEELMRERRRAFTELSSVEANADVYKKQKALQ